MTTLDSALPSGRFTGMRAFLIFWLGQMVSLLGTGMSRFALTLWAWELTGTATALALVGLFSFAPGVLLGPIAGTLVDRWDRRLTLMISDLGAGLATVVLFLLYSAGGLQLWHLYLAAALASAFESFQFPAQSAAVSTMLSKEQYTRASGMLGLADSVSGIFAAPLAGLLFAVIGLGGILVIDIVTFVLAVLAVMLITVPNPVETAEGRASREGSFWQEVSYGWRYIVQRPSLLGLQLVFFSINLTATFGFAILSPMILARSGNDEVVLGLTASAAGVGGVIGGLMVSAWGGPKRRVHGVLLGMAANSLLGPLLLGIGQALPVWLIGSFFSSALIPVLNGSNQAIWQAKVAPDVQGRVFATRRLIAQITVPFAMVMAGPLADNLFEPGMQAEGALAGVFGWLVGTGPGAGMALMFVISGLLGIAVGLGGYLFPAVRNAEDILPDHQQTAAPAG